MSTTPILPNGRVLRYTFHERLVHWLAASSYLYLLLTGLAFWSPWLFWLAAVARRAYDFARACTRGRADLRRSPLPRMYGMWGRQMHETETDKQFWRARSRITFATKTNWFHRRSLQRRTEAALLGIFLVRNPAAALRIWFSGSPI